MFPWRYLGARDSEEVHRRFHQLIRDLYYFIRYLLFGSPPAVDNGDEEGVSVPDLVANIQDSSLVRRPERDRDDELS